MSLEETDLLSVRGEFECTQLKALLTKMILAIKELDAKTGAAEQVGKMALQHSHQQNVSLASLQEEVQTLRKNCIQNDDYCKANDAKIKAQCESFDDLVEVLNSTRNLAVELKATQFKQTEVEASIVKCNKKELELEESISELKKNHLDDSCLTTKKFATLKSQLLQNDVSKRMKLIEDSVKLLTPQDNAMVEKEDFPKALHDLEERVDKLSRQSCKRDADIRFIASRVEQPSPRTIVHTDIDLEIETSKKRLSEVEGKLKVVASLSEKTGRLEEQQKAFTKRHESDIVAVNSRLEELQSKQQDVDLKAPKKLEKELTEIRKTVQTSFQSVTAFKEEIQESMNKQKESLKSAQAKYDSKMRDFLAKAENMTSRFETIEKAVQETSSFPSKIDKLKQKLEASTRDVTNRLNDTLQRTIQLEINERNVPYAALQKELKGLTAKMTEMEDGTGKPMNSQRSQLSALNEKVEIVYKELVGQLELCHEAMNAMKQDLKNELTHYEQNYKVDSGKYEAMVKELSNTLTALELRQITLSNSVDELTARFMKFLKNDEFLNLSQNTSVIRSVTGTTLVGNAGGTLLPKELDFYNVGNFLPPPPAEASVLSVPAVEKSASAAYQKTSTPSAISTSKLYDSNSSIAHDTNRLATTTPPPQANAAPFPQLKPYQQPQPHTITYNQPPPQPNHYKGAENRSVTPVSMPASARRPKLGVELLEAMHNSTKDTMVSVLNVTPGGACDEAGVEPGDIVLLWNNTPIFSKADFGKCVEGSSLGSIIDLILLRQREQPDGKIIQQQLLCKVVMKE